jgi:hypothetical protein
MIHMVHTVNAVCSILLFTIHRTDGAEREGCEGDQTVQNKISGTAELREPREP